MTKRKSIFNKSCGILLGYAGIMLAAVSVCMGITAGMIFAQSALAGEPIPMENLLTDPRVIGSGVGYLISSALCILMIRIWKGRGFLMGSLTPKKPMTALRFLEFLSVFMGLQMVGSLVIQFTETLLNHWGLSAMAALEAASGTSVTASMFIYVGICAPITEELLFRGAIQKTFEPLGKRFSILASAALFGLFHGNIAQIPYAFMVGIVLSVVAAEYGLGWSILLHFINNCIFAQILSQYAAVSSALTLLLALGAIGVVTVKGNHIHRYWKSLPKGEKGTWKDFFTSPVMIVFLIYCLVSAILTITPI